jgi:hypothetical protein
MLDNILAAFINLAIKIREVAKILWPMIKTWFKERIAMIRSDVANLAFSIKNVLANGKHEVVQGIFNKNTGEMYNTQAQDLQAPEVDEETANEHRNHRLLIFN